MRRLDKGDASCFFVVGLEKSDALLQTLNIVHYPSAVIARVTNPATKRSSVVAVVKAKSFDFLTTALTTAVQRLLWAVFLWGRRLIAT